MDDQEKPITEEQSEVVEPAANQQMIPEQATQPDQPWYVKARRQGKTAAGGIGALAILLFKFKSVLLLILAKLKFVIIPLKYLKFGKVFTTMGSMLASIVIDATMWGWSFAIGFVLLLFVHEMGHLLAIRAKGMRAGAPVFIPFVGAVIALKDMPHDAKTEAEIGIAGPALGTLGALGCLALGGQGQMALFTRLAYIGFLLNLFNLLPVLPLDGGRVMAAISPKVWLLGLALALLLFLRTHNPILLILIILSVGRTWHALKSDQSELDYYKVPGATRAWMTAAYFGLAGFLGIMVAALRHS